jgi:hypothetical protein
MCRVRMLGAERLLVDRQCARKERLCRREVGLGVKQTCEAIEAQC